MLTPSRSDLAAVLALSGELRALAILASLRFVSEGDLLRAGVEPETLSGLAHAELALRLPLQRSLTASAPIAVFALRRAGAVVLAQALSMDASAVPSDTLSSCRRTVLWLDHALARSRFALLLAGAAAEWGDVSLRSWTQAEAELQIAAAARADGDARALRPLIPDAAARLLAKGRDETLIIEIDRGTERPSYMAAKYAAYRTAWKSGALARAAGASAVRILTVAPDERRVGRLRRACQDGTAGRTDGLFWFAAETALERSGATAPCWSTMSRESLALWQAPRA